MCLKTALAISDVLTKIQEVIENLKAWVLVMLNLGQGLEFCNQVPG